MIFLRKLYDNLEEYACATFVGVMIICLALQVIMRFIFGSALAWTEELSRFAFLWSVYVGAAYAVKKGVLPGFLWVTELRPVWDRGPGRRKRSRWRS